MKIIRNIFIAPLVLITAVIEIHYFICRTFIAMKDNVDHMLPKFK